MCSIAALSRSRGASVLRTRRPWSGAVAAVGNADRVYRSCPAKSRYRRATAGACVGDSAGEAHRSSECYGAQARGGRERVPGLYCGDNGAAAKRLDDTDPDDELLTAAGDIICALIAGGPAYDIDDDEDALWLPEAYLRLLSDRAGRPEHLAVVDNIRGFLLDIDRWPERYQRGWSAKQRAALLAACEQIMFRHP
jgi:hypothetical protein